MSNLVDYRQPESSHWYGPDGEPRHDADLRVARKEKLYPSVTSILAIKEKPQLSAWKVEQALSQALTMQRFPQESDWAFIKRVLEQDKEERAKAPDLGTAVHKAIAEYITAGGFPVVGEVDMAPTYRWIDEHVDKPTAQCEVRFASYLGYGGCIDFVGLVDGKKAIIDWKTQSVKKTPAFYDEWVWQLAAYYGRDSTALGPNFYNGSQWISVVIDTRGSGCYPMSWTPEDAKRGWNGFLGLLEAWIADRKYNPREQDIPW